MSMLRDYFKKLRVHLQLSRDFKHYLRLWLTSLRQDSAYKQYLNTQLKRTLLKRYPEIQERTKYLVDHLIDIGSPGKDVTVLCIGCRNTAEIDYLKSKGFRHVTGIDLYSESPDILVMDMHRMTFPDNHFGVVYSSHSLEHSYDAQKVVSEILRVARSGALIVIEVPVRYEKTGAESADLADFENLDNLYNLFGDVISTVLWSDEQPPRSPTNNSGTAIVRAIFTIQKLS